METKNIINIKYFIEGKQSIVWQDNTYYKVEDMKHLHYLHIHRTALILQATKHKSFLQN